MNARSKAIKNVEAMLDFQKKSEVKSDSKLETLIPGFKILSAVAQNSRHKVYYAEECPPAETAARHAPTPTQRFWYLKKADDALTAARELIFQELLRCVIGDDQPKTKVVRNPQNGDLYIASSAIKNAVPMYNPPCRLLTDEILQGNLVRLGELVFLAKLFEHEDTSLRNLLYDAALTPYLVDGEHALTSLLSDNPLNETMITASDVKFFPMLINHNQPEFGWLDQIISAPNEPTMKCRDHSMLCKKLYRSNEFQYGAMQAGILILNVRHLIPYFISNLLINNHLKINQDIIVKRVDQLLKNAVSQIPQNRLFNDKTFLERFSKDYKDFTQRLIAPGSEYLSLLAPPKQIPAKTPVDDKKADNSQKIVVSVKKSTPPKTLVDDKKADNSQKVVVSVKKSTPPKTLVDGKKADNTQKVVVSVKKPTRPSLLRRLSSFQPKRVELKAEKLINQSQTAPDKRPLRRAKSCT